MCYGAASIRTCMTVASPVALHQESMAHHPQLALSLALRAMDPILLPQAEGSMVASTTLVGSPNFPRSLDSLHMWVTYPHKAWSSECQSDILTTEPLEL